jgi:hypothetical protein
VRVDVTPVEGDYNRHSNRSLNRDWNRGSRH